MHGFSSSLRKTLNYLDTRKRQIVSVALGLSLLALGTVSTFLTSNGAGSAALIAGGTVLLMVTLLDERITWLKVGNLEFQLRETARQLNHQATNLEAQGNYEAAEQLREEAGRLLLQASPAARAYEEIRRTRPPLAQRIAEMSKLVDDAYAYSQEHHPSAEAVHAIFTNGDDGERVYALALMQADPEVADFECVINAISESHSAFEQNHGLRTALAMLRHLNSAEKKQLVPIIRQQLVPDGHIARSTSRRQLAEKLLNALGK